MNKFIPCLLSGLLMLGSLSATSYQRAFNNTSSSSQINWQTSYSSAVSQAQSESKQIVILFTGTTWCPACMKLEREVLNRSEFTSAVAHRFVFLKAEFPDSSTTDSSPYADLMQRYNVEAFPTFIVTNANGQFLYEVDYQTGGPIAYAQDLLRQN